MSTRIASLMNNAQSLQDLQRIKQQYSQSTHQLSSGKAMVNVGDDPAGNAKVMNYQSSLDVNDKHISQANTANSRLQSASTALTTMGGEINRILELGQEGMASSATPGSQQPIAVEVDSLRSDLIALGNTQEQGRYIFSGTHTKKVPFTPDGVYHGNQGVVRLEVGTGTPIATNIPGDTLFFGAPATVQGTATDPNADLLAQTKALSTALMANDPGAIQTAYKNLQAISDRLNISVADLGGRMNGITAVQNGLDAYNLNLKTLQSSIASADYPATMTQLNQETMSQQAALGTMAKNNQKNLFDYIA